MPTVSIHMIENTGLSGFTLYLRKTSDGTLVNTGGDAMTESPSGSGRFTATVAESWSELLSAYILDSGSFAVRDGWLAVGETVIRDAYPSELDAVSMNGATIYRPSTDTDAIRFAWPVSGATITGEVSVSGGTYGSVTGAITFLRTEGGVHWYQLAYNAADRATGAVRYKFVDGTYTRFVNLHVNASFPSEAPANWLKPAGIQDGAFTAAKFAALGTATVSTGSTATSVTTSACSPTGAAEDQFKGRVIIFGNSTTTTALRGCAALISASSNSATPTFTLASPLPTSPVSGDTFVIA